MDLRRSGRVPDKGGRGSITDRRGGDWGGGGVLMGLKMEAWEDERGTDRKAEEERAIKSFQHRGYEAIELTKSRNRWHKTRVCV